MRVHVLTAALIVISGAAMAEQAGFAPLTDVVQAATASEEVRRDKARALKSFGDVALEQASVSDVDANGDGHISFEELLKFDAKNF